MEGGEEPFEDAKQKAYSGHFYGFFCSGNIVVLRGIERLKELFFSLFQTLRTESGK